MSETRHVDFCVGSQSRKSKPSKNAKPTMQSYVKRKKKLGEILSSRNG